MLNTAPSVASRLLGVNAAARAEPPVQAVGSGWFRRAGLDAVPAGLLGGGLGRAAEGIPGEYVRRHGGAAAVTVSQACRLAVRSRRYVRRGVAQRSMPVARGAPAENLPGAGAAQQLGGAALARLDGERYWRGRGRPGCSSQAWAAALLGSRTCPPAEGVSRPRPADRTRRPPSPASPSPPQPSIAAGARSAEQPSRNPGSRTAAPGPSSRSCRPLPRRAGPLASSRTPPLPRRQTRLLEAARPPARPLRQSRNPALPHRSGFGLTPVYLHRTGLQPSVYAALLLPHIGGIQRSTCQWTVPGPRPDPA